jgi:3-oxoacyl-[acyl-carrier-protein] synthase-3
MDGGGIFNFTLDAVPEMMKDILVKNRLTAENVDYYVFHQANKFMLSTIRKVCVLPKEKFYINLEETGNTVSSTVMISLKDCIQSGTITQGMNVMISGFGVGLSWGGTILRIIHNPK